MKEHRRHERYPIEVEVEVALPRKLLFSEKRRMRTRDMSQSGLFLEADGKPLPPVGAELRLRVIRDPSEGEPMPLVRARVVRATPQGIAVCFLEP
jgi:hypothetical protein